MRAAVINSFGGPEVLQVIDVATPEPRRGQVRVRIAAAAVNPVDVATAAGIMHQVGNAPARAETGLGWDLAGTVDAVGPEVTGYAVGDQVIGILDRVGAPRGSFAEYAIADTGQLAKAPATATPAEASTIPLPGLTAWQALAALGLKAGQSLFVSGAAGTLGAFTVQLAAARGIEVLAQGGEGDKELLRSLGAAHVIRRGEDAGEAVREIHPSGVDGAVDAAVIGIAALDTVRNGGGIAMLVGTVPRLRNITVHDILIHADPHALAELVSLADAGGLDLRVAGTYPLSGIAAAYERFGEGGLRGRLVLEP
ncbi:NADP-dependent oxidoreductase [Phytomonospora endophytica]|uniref:NADPH:quinone reductase-like Zn-dependent oxidoreductase n=1 Tax=Phytomonospora endophytica TaxID=714109 RepID=A0A841FM60_9ACTN|nr:NADP-dependent oxidoreductase [Phytomonospora endophytica]MBB6037226.1 NADPH:quinone reductase-like Zn-dependent oxidoreductase [Phytomonospora endophytica]GIG71272.1 NADPH:quinone reductase [Phytomonospora endophytica]